MEKLVEKRLDDLVCEVVKAEAIEATERIQSLWGGYGTIFRFSVRNAKLPGVGASVIVKSVRPPSEKSHPRGWISDLSHERKLRSYRVEKTFYRDYSSRCGSACRVPQAYFLSEIEGCFHFLLEDLDGVGFPRRIRSLTDAQFKGCLRWLAEFHAEFLGADCEGLWETGTYWHLATRPDELQVMADGQLKGAAHSIDRRLSAARFKTLVHGDAKVANFCFPRHRESERGVAAVDFQYAGAGCGVKDVAYLMSSCLDEHECEARADEWLDEYFRMFRQGLERRSVAVDFAALEKEWRFLYAFAWADFVRFLRGWAPDHFKLHGYSRKMTELALSEVGRSRS